MHVVVASALYTVYISLKSIQSNLQHTHCVLSLSKYSAFQQCWSLMFNIDFSVQRNLKNDQGIFPRLKRSSGFELFPLS